MVVPDSLKDWFDKTFLGLARNFKWSYLPPLMVYLAAGISGTDCDRRDIFHQGLSGTFSEFSRRAFILGGYSLGVENAPRPSC